MDFIDFILIFGAVFTVYFLYCIIQSFFDGQSSSLPPGGPTGPLLGEDQDKWYGGG